MKNRVYQTKTIYFVIYAIFNLACQALDPIPITKFSTFIDTSNVSYTTATVKSKFMDVGEDIITYGHCWDTEQNPTIDHFKTVFSDTPQKQVEFISELDQLNLTTRYYIRAYAITKRDTLYSNEINFSTIPLFDVDGNNYKLVKIGSQIWMAENLRTTKYSNGDEIGTTEPATLDLTAETEPKYQWVYDDYQIYVTTYGRLYTWYAANDNRSICPTGWHLPGDAELTQLTDYLGGTDNAGGKLKETGTTHWSAPNEGATNEYGFTALPGGCRYSNGTFNYDRGCGYFWSATEAISADAWYRAVFNNRIDVFRGPILKKVGFTIRCIKN